MNGDNKSGIQEIDSSSLGLDGKEAIPALVLKMDDVENSLTDKSKDGNHVERN